MTSYKVWLHIEKEEDGEHSEVIEPVDLAEFETEGKARAYAYGLEDMAIARAIGEEVAHA